jgi:hypothetical protein
MRGGTVVLLVALAFAVGGCGRHAPTAAPQRVRAFASDAQPIAESGVVAAEGGWRIERSQGGSVQLFEVPDPGVDYATLTYRARMKAEDVQGKAYLEMWVRVPGRGEFFSRGLAQPLHGSSGWASYEIPFFLDEHGLRPDLVKLNVGFEGGGTVWVKDVELLQTPLG